MRYLRDLDVLVCRKGGYTIGIGAELLNTDIDISSCNEGTLEWVDIDNVLCRVMPFSAKESLKHYLAVGRYDSHLYAGVTTERGIEFVILDEF